MPHVLLICEFPTLAGGERSMLAILPTLTEDGIEFSVIAPPVGPLAEAFEQLAIPLTPLYSLNSAGEKKSQVEMRESLASSISEIKPDVVHANSLAMGRMVGPVCQQLGIASISHLRDIIKLSKQAIADLNCNTRLVAVSHAVRDHHVAAGLSSEKTEVLYNGVDLDVFQPRSPTGFLHRELKIPPQSQLIAIIGQICLRKGLDVFAEAARLLAQSNDDLHFIVIGSRFSQKQESCELEQRLIDLSLGELHGKLHLLGERTDVHQILNEITVLIHASRQEPLGRVLLEASAAGLPVVATDVGGTREIFPAESDAARIVAVDNAQQIADEVIGLTESHQMRTQISQNARTNAENRFSFHTAASGMLAIYEKMLP